MDEIEIRNKINKILGDFSYELVDYLTKHKIIKIDKGKRMDSKDIWIEFIKKDKRWKKYHTMFINAKYNEANRFIKKVAKTEEGQRIIVKIYNIKNIKGYPDLLNKLQ